MRVKLILLVLLAFFTNIYSQDLLSLTPAGKSSSPAYSDEIEKITKTINSLVSMRTSKSLESYIVKGISLSKEEVDLLVEELRKEKSQLVLNKLKAEKAPEQKPTFKIAGEIKLRPEGDDNDFLAPILQANYKDIFWKTKGTFEGQYDFTLAIRAPSSNSDSLDQNAMLTQILSSGADGMFKGEVKLGWVNSARTKAFLFGTSFKINWLNAKSEGNENFASFAYTSYNHLLAAKLGPVMLAYEQEFRFAGADSEDIVSLGVDKSMSGNLLVGLDLNEAMIQLKYLLHANTGIAPDQRLEINVGAAFSISI